MWFIGARRLLQALKDAPGKQITKQAAQDVLTNGFPFMGPDAVQKIQDELTGRGFITGDAVKNTLTPAGDALDIPNFVGVATVAAPDAQKGGG